MTDAPVGWTFKLGLGWVWQEGERTTVLGAGLWQLVSEQWRFTWAPEPEIETPATLDATAAADLDDLDRVLIGLRMQHPDKTMADLAMIAATFLGRDIGHDLARQRFVRLQRRGLIPPEDAARARKLKAGRKGATPPSKVNITEHHVGGPGEIDRTTHAGATRKARRALNAVLRDGPPEQE